MLNGTKQFESSIGLNPYESLANAIIVSACDDYMETSKMILKLKHREEALAKIGVTLSETDKNALISAEKGKADCLMFFRSDWYVALTSLDPEFLVKKLEKELEKYGND